MTFGTVIALIKAGLSDSSSIAEAVDAWLEAHPEATTTVQDGSITKAKLVAALSSEITQNTEDVADLKSQINNKAPVIINSASGDIASFADGADGMPVKALSVNVEPIQAGSGYPSPDNVRPISGRTSATIYHSGADTSNPTTYTIQLGDTVYGGTLDVTGGKMVVDRAMADLGTMAWGCQSPPQFFSNGIAATSINWKNWNDTPPLICSRYKPISNSLLASSDFCIGYAYNSKQLRVKDSGFTDAASFETAMSGVQLVYELATPLEITLTPTQINTLLGTNNVWSDAGDVAVDYRADTKLYIDNIHTPTDDDMTADAQIASGKYFLICGNLYLSTTTIPAGDTIIPGTNCTRTNLAEALNSINI